jgi:formylglycine-generating enzyme required for sulfatase activity
MGRTQQKGAPMHNPFESDDDANRAHRSSPRVIGIACVALLALIGLWWSLSHRRAAVQGPEPANAAEQASKEPRDTGAQSTTESSEFSGNQAGQTRADNGLNMPLVWIPPGEFTMGSSKDEKERSDDESQVQVTLTKGFWLGQHEVMQTEWQRVMQTTRWSGEINVKEGDDYPATYVSWEDATNFCEKLT